MNMRIVNVLDVYCRKERTNSPIPQTGRITWPYGPRPPSLSLLGDRMRSEKRMTFRDLASASLDDMFRDMHMWVFHSLEPRRTVPIGTEVGSVGFV